MIRMLTLVTALAAAMALTLAGAVRAQDGEIDTSLVEDMALGNPEAPVTVIEYASFTCPHCKRFHAEVLPLLRKNYIEPGKVRLVYREVYFDRYGLWAGLLARCGGPLRYFGIAEMIYEKQAEWTDGDAATVAGNLRRLGKAAGLSDEDLDRCFSNRDLARAMVAVYQQNATADNINATPSFVINGKKYLNMSYEDFAAILDGLLAE